MSFAKTAAAGLVALMLSGAALAASPLKVATNPTFPRV